MEQGCDEWFVSKAQAEVLVVADTAVERKPLEGSLAAEIIRLPDRGRRTKTRSKYSTMTESAEQGIGVVVVELG